MAFILARQNQIIETEDEELAEILSNSKLSDYFHSLAKDLDVAEAKTPEDIYKSHLENTRPGFSSTNVDSAKQNLASTFVNAFVNAGFGADKLLTASEDGNWIYKNKEHGMMSASASLGMILLWDVDSGLSQIDKYLYSQEDYIKVTFCFLSLRRGLYYLLELLLQESEMNLIQLLHYFLNMSMIQKYV